MLNEVLQALEHQKSYSRAGRLLEGRGAARSVSLFNQKSPVLPMDMSKVLSVTEVNGAEATGEADALCSSARDHPSVAQKSAYIMLSEKRNLFDNSLHTLVRQDDANPSPVRNKREENFESLATDASEQNISSPHRIDKGSSSFLAVPRSRTQKVQQQNPPVGHYNPRYTAVEPLTYNCVLPKQIRNRQRAHTPEPATSSPICSPERSKTSLGDITRASPGASPKRKGISDRSPSQEQSANVQTWPFRSRTVAHYSPPPTVVSHEAPPLITYNESLVTKRQPMLCNMSRDNGRREEPAGISVDLMYNPPLSAIKVANLKMDRTTGRGEVRSKARTSSEVPRSQSRLNIDNYAKFKYAKQAVIADFDKYPSKDVWINSSLPIKLNHSTNRSELPSNSGTTLLESMDRTRDVSFKLMLPRRDPKQSDGFGLEYDATFDFKEKHMPSTYLAKAPKRQLNATPQHFEASEAIYYTEVDKYKKKLSRSIPFDSFPTREERERTGRASKAVLHETQADLDPSFDALSLPPTMRPVVKGDPRMGTHVSRARRERALSPPTDSHDLMYSYNVDAHRMPLRKGAVAFERMVSREHHGGSAFANSMKEMVRK